MMKKILGCILLIVVLNAIYTTSIGASTNGSMIIYIVLGAITFVVPFLIILTFFWLFNKRKPITTKAIIIILLVSIVIGCSLMFYGRYNAIEHIRNNPEIWSID